MKKFLIIFAMLFTVSMFTYANVGDVFTNSVDSVYHDGRAAMDTLYHDSKTAVGTMYNDAKSGLASVYPDVKSAVVSIGKAIGVAAEHVYGVLVKKYFVIGIKQLCIFLMGLIALIIGFVGWKKVTPTGQPVTYRVVVPLMFIIAGIITIFNVNYDDMLMGLINPEYGAIDYILEYTKSLVN